MRCLIQLYGATASGLRCWAWDNDSGTARLTQCRDVPWDTPQVRGCLAWWLVARNCAHRSSSVPPGVQNRPRCECHQFVAADTHCLQSPASCGAPALYRTAPSRTCFKAMRFLVVLAYASARSRTCTAAQPSIYHHLHMAASNLKKLHCIPSMPAVCSGTSCCK